MFRCASPPRRPPRQSARVRDQLPCLRRGSPLGAHTSDQHDVQGRPTEGRLRPRCCRHRALLFRRPGDPRIQAMVDAAQQSGPCSQRIVLSAVSRVNSRGLYMGPQRGLFDFRMMPRNQPTISLRRNGSSSWPTHVSSIDHTVMTISLARHTVPRDLCGKRPCPRSSGTNERPVMPPIAWSACAAAKWSRCMPIRTRARPKKSSGDAR